MMLCSILYKKNYIKKCGSHSAVICAISTGWIYGMTDHSPSSQDRMSLRRTLGQLQIQVWTLNRHHNTSSVKGMLEDLQWRTLEQRRTDCRLVLLFQIPPTSYLQPSLNTMHISQKPQLYVSTMLDKNKLF